MRKLVHAAEDRAASFAQVIFASLTPSVLDFEEMMR